MFPSKVLKEQFFPMRCYFLGHPLESETCYPEALAVSINLQASNLDTSSFRPSTVVDLKHGRQLWKNVFAIGPVSIRHSQFLECQFFWDLTSTGETNIAS
jgi:hypothetical protein